MKEYSFLDENNKVIFEIKNADIIDKINIFENNIIRFECNKKISNVSYRIK
jgi:hypothetical protein